jgi:hypothetical protein
VFALLLGCCPAAADGVPHAAPHLAMINGSLVDIAAAR